MTKRWLTKNLTGIIGISLLLITIFAAVVGPEIYRVDPKQAKISLRLTPPVLFGGTMKYPLGTDQIGRDILSRLLHGARISLIVASCSVLISISIGVPVGLLTGYRAGLLDDIVMRIGDAQLSIPFLIMAITIIAILGPSLTNVVLILGVTGWIQFARMIRAETLRLREEEYITAAKALGASEFRIMTVHILPNAAPIIIVVATFQFALMIIVEASLGFLGLGVPPPTPSWGSMINDGRSYLQVAWWLTTIPGIAITAVVLGTNLFGDWLRDYLDPQLRSSA
jgi:peptide/nickel transport system permease protein